MTGRNLGDAVELHGEIMITMVFNKVLPGRSGHVVLAINGSRRSLEYSGREIQKDSNLEIVTDSYTGAPVPLEQARVSDPHGLALDSENRLYLLDGDSLRRIDLDKD